MFPYGKLWWAGLGLPDDPERDRAARRKVWLLSVPTALSWAVVGWSGALGILDGFRLMSLDRVDAWDRGPSTVSLIVVFGVFITIASMLGFALSWADWSGSWWPGTGSGVGGFATVLGLAVGTALAASSWTAPEAVGGRLPSADGRPGVPWTFVDWVVYYAPYLLPGVFGELTVVAGALLAHAARKTRRRQDASPDLEHTGWRVTGRIDHVEFTHDWGMGNPRFAVRVSYQGTSGPRTAVATMTTSVFAAPVVGGAVDVFYDPEDDESIVIRARHDQSAWFPH
ncbi:DUF3592 domain-containing protein [Saccharothrix luteola]|uniref:DUF3592 domain-containing protein n=1 Tax=Saccharothrix luteola TaxID=2893018 RepID=UPI001E3935AF|nr:DUF3592 domain-containing protein [Saccharothrix luteola]MCC8249386.1 DUF3592 domain-containing protein [Saccharothrix luteola]